MVAPSMIMIVAVMCSCHIDSASRGSCFISGCHIVLLLCLEQKGSHADTITMTPSEQQFHNQAAMNDDDNAIITRTPH